MLASVGQREQLLAAAWRGLGGRRDELDDRGGRLWPIVQADDIYDKLAAFSNFGFAESHAISFAYIVYASAFLKRYFPAAFYAGLLNAQPMGFYSPQSLVADTTLTTPPDIPKPPAEGAIQLGRPDRPEPGIRLGLSSIRKLGDDIADQVAAGRPYADITDLGRRTALTTAQIEALAAAGALDCLGLDRRQAIWAAGPAAAEHPDRLTGTSRTGTPPVLPAMSETEQLVADLWATGVTTSRYPTELVRPWLTHHGAVTAAQLRVTPDKTRVWIGGIVTHRQRPATASGIAFLSLEDETGLINIVCHPGTWDRYRRIARESAGLLVRGYVERSGDVVNVVAEKFQKLPLRAATRSRDFRQLPRGRQDGSAGRRATWPKIGRMGRTVA